MQGATRFVATSGADGGNTCLVAGSPCRTITRALGQAVASDTISASPGIYNLALGETFPLTISKNLSLVDAGARSTILDATGASRTVVFVFSASVAIAELTVTGGAVNCTNTGSSICSAGGGGRFSTGTLTRTNVALTGNTASCTNSGSGSCAASGGSLVGGTSTTLTNVTVSGNIPGSGNGRDCASHGGGLELAGTVSLTNVTLSGNAAPGGGISNTFTNTTVRLKNTIATNSPSGGNFVGKPIVSLDHNLGGDAACGFIGSGDLNNIDPQLGPLQDNGGPTQTHALPAGSPAVDAGDNTGCPTTGGRGVDRPRGAGCVTRGATSVAVRTN